MDQESAGTIARAAGRLEPIAPGHSAPPSLPRLPDLPDQVRAWVDIDPEALAHNTRQMAALLGPGVALWAVVKANGYGHGALTVARVALGAGATGLVVATVAEGVALRRGGITAPILLLGPAHSREEWTAIAQARLEPTLVSLAQAEALAAHLGSDREPLAVHLNLDTGMTRLGCPWEAAVDWVGRIQALPGLRLASVYSHLATADEPDSPLIAQQQGRFDQAIAALKAANLCPPRCHLANSAATLLGPSFHYDGVRVGLALYGYCPGPHLGAGLSLRPALTVKARITQLRPIGPGVGISYGHRFVSDRPMTIAVVAIGYADGVRRGLSNRGQFLLHGQRVPQVGVITMDQLMIDVTAVPQVQVGDGVTLLGQETGPAGCLTITAEDWATWLDTIPWEILCGFSPRLPRRVWPAG